MTQPISTRVFDCKIDFFLPLSTCCESSLYIYLRIASLPSIRQVSRVIHDQYTLKHAFAVGVLNIVRLYHKNALALSRLPVAQPLEMARPSRTTLRPKKRLLHFQTDEATLSLSPIASYDPSRGFIQQTYKTYYLNFAAQALSNSFSASNP